MEQNDKIKAAYALNLCTVSVSQIIDYEDLYVLEQEYDAILNNLNLEQMPKDEALLHILKQLLDTITFFRIQESEKEMLERTYQYRMKEAIWSAVPNLSVVVAGGSLKTMALALASQVGISYLNYRRNKSQYILDKEQGQWRLQRTAIEQFNALRRELFDTAWRLAAAYEFPDEYRLTERQIGQYNQILMDPDDLRRYERLEFIKDKFLAYPPFWYYLGNAANHISQGAAVPAAARALYKEKALECFERFEESEKYDLLREDQLACSCMLEHVELLDTEKDRERIEHLLQKVVKKSGNANDILQLCATGFLRIGDLSDAEPLFRRLVNEQYNTVTNAQILSSIYIRKKLMRQEDAGKIEADYNLLATRVDKKYLFPDTIYIEDSDKMFLLQQRQIMKQKIELVLGAFEEKCGADFDQLLLRPESTNTFTNSQEFRKFAELLKESNYSAKVIDYLNRMMHALDELNFVREYQDKEQLVNLIADEIRTNANILTSARMSMDNGSFSVEEYHQVEQLTFDRYTEDFFTFLNVEGKAYCDKITSLEGLASEEENIRRFCDAQNIKEPDIMFSERNDLVPEDPEKFNYFDEDILGGYIQETKIRSERCKEMLEIVRRRKTELFGKGGKIRLYLKGDPDFNTYFYRKDMKRQNLRGIDTVAVLDDTGFSDNDLLFTVEGVVRVERGTAKKVIPYSDIRYKDQGKGGLEIQGFYSNPALNISQLMSLIKELSAYQVPVKKDIKNKRREIFFNNHGCKI